VFVGGIADRPLSAGKRDQDFARRAPDPIRIRVGASEEFVDFIMRFKLRQRIISS
jgi:hypothetical protein